MIFSRFFAPSHNSNDPDTRLKAIEKLSPDSQNEKRILHELAFNDDDERVSLAALEKLDTFALWLKMSQIARNPRLRGAAQAKVECALIDGSQQLSQKEAKEYLLKSAPAEQVLRCLPLMTELHDDESFVLQAIERVGKAALYFDLMTLTPSSGLKRCLVNNCVEVELLLKALKKCSDNETEALIQARIEVLKQLAQKPLDVARNCTMVLSKMQALLDKSDYLLVHNQFSALNDEYQTSTEEFHCLDVTTREAFEQKYHTIADKLHRHLARLEGPWREAQQAGAHREAKQQVAETVERVKQYHNKLQGEQLLSLSLGEVSEFQQAVKAAEAAIEALQAFEAPAEEIESLLESYRHIWDSLPALQRQVAELQAQLQRWKQEAESGDEDPTTLDADNIQQTWKQCTSEMVVVPSFLLTQWKALNKLLNAQKQKQQAEQQSALKACRKHINIIDNLIVQGKFKSAMVRFAKLSEIYQQMPVTAQQVIEKRYLQIEADIARLEGWQNYIAAPRKPQLIEQAQALVATTDTDMPGRAKAVKVLRQQWQSLGSTGSDDDESLNQQFNALLEEAFVPCRVYFAELETAQANAAEERVQLISALSALTEDTVEQSDRYTRFEALKKQWQQAPQTDAERYSQLRAQWDAVSEQVNNLLSPWIQRNREIKEQLVSQTEALSKADNAIAASEQAKALQQQWKQTGPAGKRVESKLWFAFKAANDDVFARAKSQQQQARHQQRSESQQWLQALDKLKAEIDDAAQASQQTALDSLADSLSAMSMNPKERKGLELQLRKVMSTLQDALTLQQHELWGEQIDVVIDEISKQQGTDAGSLSEQAPDLPNSWWKGSALQNEEALQHDLLMLEVLAQLPSPAEYESARSTVQLQLMQSKLSGNALPEPNVLIAGIIASAGEFESSTGASWEQRLRDILSYYVLPVAGV